jgi:aminoglycoside phosphotransferase (APT) family kinase protein
LSAAGVDPSIVDIERLADWMDTQGLGTGAITDVDALAGGTQNVLLRFSRAGRSYVLRRPPPHPREKSNETMRREARVLGAIADSAVPHPRLIAACGETEPLGAAFYLMEPIEGFNPTQGLPAFHAGDPQVRFVMGMSLVDSIAALGALDYLAIGLDGFGRPERYLERQVERWRAQLESYASTPGYPGPDIPGVDRVGDWLDENRPIDHRPGVIHGDYHLANVMYRNDSPELAAIVDWELSTVGDPLLDLGWLLATWPDAEAEGPSPGAIGVTPWDGFPSAEELVARYAEHSERNLDAITWYKVLACYKLGIILEGTFARACAGKAPKATGDLLHATTVGLFERALASIA